MKEMVVIYKSRRKQNTDCLLAIITEENSSSMNLITYHSGYRPVSYVHH